MWIKGGRREARWGDKWREEVERKGERKTCLLREEDRISCLHYFLSTDIPSDYHH